MKFQTTIPILLALALIGGCKNSTVIESNDLGTIRGKVTEYGSSAVSGVDALPLPQQGGATITIEGTPFTTTSNSTSEWEIDRVPAGIYALIFSKPGFDTTILPQYEFSGAGTAFLEKERINQTRPPLLDSIPFTVVVHRFDSIRYYYGDTMGYAVDTLIAYTYTLTCNLVGPDPIAQFHLTIYYQDSTGKALVREGNISVTSGWPFTFTPLSNQWEYPWYNYLFTKHPNAPKPGTKYILGIRALPTTEAPASPTEVRRQIVLP